MKTNLCHNCTAGEWGFCYHAEYGECRHFKNKETYMKKQYTRTELEQLNFFELLNVAEALQVENYEHLVPVEQIEAILDKQKVPEPAEMEEVL